MNEYAIVNEVDALRSPYSPLQNGYIRLLVLQPGPQDAPLLASLQESQLADVESQEFEAVSYCWGDLTHPQLLTIAEGGSILITRSLSAALQSFRYTHQSRSLWADAVCINQDDVRERSSQVAMMGEIYARAKQVLVWLGPALSQDTETLAFTTLSAPITAKGDRSRRELLDLLDNHLAQSSQCACCGQSVTRSSVSLSDGLVAVAKLLERPWFQRLWVVQEVALAQHIEIYCGNHHAHWNIFTEVARVPGQYELENDFESDSGLPVTLPRANLRQVWARCNYLNQLRARNRTKKGIKDAFRPTALCKDLLMLSHLGCSDPHDRIYGVRRVLGLENFPQLQPDYSISVAELYCRTVELFLTAPANRTGGHASVMLALAGTEYPDAEVQNRPSWVPDLQHLSERSRSKHTYYYWAFADRQFYAEAADFRCKVSNKDPRELLVRGKCFGTIENVLEASDCPSKHVHRRSVSKCPDDEGEALVKWYLRCRGFIAQNGTRDSSSVHQPLDDQIAEIFHCNAPEERIAELPTFHPSRIDRWLSCLRGDALLEVGINAVLRSVHPYITGYPHDRERNLCYIRTTSGPSAAAWVPPAAHAGDKVVYLAGAPFPFVVRSNRNGSYTLLGDAFVQDFNEAEVMELEVKVWIGMLDRARIADTKLKQWLESADRAALKASNDLNERHELRDKDTKIKEDRQMVLQQMRALYQEGDLVLGWIRLR